MKKILRITTVPISLKVLLKGQLSFLTDNGFIVYTASAGGEEIDSLYQDEKIEKHFELGLTRRITPLKDLLAIYQCYVLIKKINPDIVHTNTPKAGMVGIIAAKLANSPIRIHSVGGLPLMEKTGIFKMILVIIEKITYLFATNVYCNSYGLLRYINNNISTNSKIKIIASGSTNGIDINYFKRETNYNVTKKTLNFQESDFVWLYVGRLVKDKGINELISAYTEIINRFGDMSFKLLLVGNFENDLDPLDLTSYETIKSNSTIIQIDFKSDIRPYLALANCLVFPSYREGLPNVPMQAACFELPIIATNINGCNEIVIDEFNGILIKPKDIKSLVDAMVKIITNNSLRESFSKVTRSYISSRYEQKYVWSEILNEYKTLLSK